MYNLPQNSTVQPLPQNTTPQPIPPYQMQMTQMNLQPIPQQQQIIIINQNIEIFGPSYFNIYDPYYLQHKNTPKKVELFSNIYFIGSLVAGIILIVLQIIQPSVTTYPIIIIVQGYVIYLCASICCSSTRGYISNVHPYTEYQSIYDSMVQAKAYFHFWTQCWHNQTYRDSKGHTHTRRVVTHTATLNFQVSKCTDESGVLGDLNQQKTYVFLNCLSRFYFDTQQSQANYQRAYRNFVTSNKRDTYQSSSSTFTIPGFQEQIGFTFRGQSAHSIPLFYTFTLIGLAYPYAMILQQSVARYQITFLKKLTV